MNAETPTPTSRDAIEAAIVVHDQAAADLMRAATKHLRRSTALERQLGALDRRDQRGSRES